ncbi:MAG: hypothetical protein F4X12_16465 [Acidobacteriia bacterium]|nr:hypothetical protein [Terriglobia bacterium]
MADGISLVRPEVEEPVPDDGPSDGGTEAVVVKARLLSDAAPLVGLVQRVQRAVREVLVKGAVDIVAPAADHRVELASGGAAEFRAVLVLQQREFRHRLVRHVHDAPRDALVVVVDALDHEVVVARPLAANRGAFAQARAAAGSDARAL